jgi:putative membrane protein
MNGFFHGSGMWFGGWFWIVIILIVVFVFLRARGGNCPIINRNTQETPLEILKKRYAKGEITKEEFEEMKKNL